MVQRPHDPFLIETSLPAHRNPNVSLVRLPFAFPCASSEQQRSKVGFPIRRFTDQSLFAAPHDLSQRTTSFIASQRQGIHRIPLRHLIALIIDAHRSARKTCTPFWSTSQRARSYKDQFASNTSEDGAVMLRPLTVALAFSVITPKQSDVFPLYDVR